MSSGQLLAVVGVDKAERVVCQATGCGRGVYRRVHVVLHEDDSLGVYGSNCFERLFGHLIARTPRYGGGDGRALTAEERDMLANNTERLIAQFEQEHQAVVAIAQAERERQECAAIEMRERQLRFTFPESAAPRKLTPEEFAKGFKGL